MKPASLDAIGLEVFQESLVATVAEMRVTVLRTAFSSIIYEGQDFSCWRSRARMRRSTWDR